jgi:hypothetical protein
VNHPITPAFRRRVAHALRKAQLGTRHDTGTRVHGSARTRADVLFGAPASSRIRLRQVLPSSPLI